MIGTTSEKSAQCSSRLPLMGGFYIIFLFYYEMKFGDLWRNSKMTIDSLITLYGDTVAVIEDDEKLKDGPMMSLT